MVRVLVGADRQDLRDALVGLEGQQVRHVLALRVASPLGDLVGLSAVDAPQVGEEQQPVVGGGDEEVLHHVAAAQLGAPHPLAAALLGAVVVGAGALGEAVAGDGDDHVLLGDQILHGHLAVEGEDRRAALVAELVDDLGQLLRDDRPLALGLVQDVAQVVHARFELGVLIEDLLALQGGQAPQLQRQDGVGLDGVDVEQVDEPGPRLVDGGGAADQGDDLVEGVEGLEVALQDVQALHGLAQPEARAPHDHVDLVGDPVADEPVDGQGARHPVDQGQHVRGEVLLQGRALVQVVEDDLGDGVAFEDDDEALARAPGGLVADVGDPLDLAVAHQLRDLVGQVVGVDLVGELGDHQALAALDLLDADDGALGDGAASRAVGVLDALVAQDGGAGGEVGAGDEFEERLQQFLAGGSGVVEGPLDAAGQLAQVVRGDARGHADRDALGPVGQQIGEAGGQDGRLLVAPVVVVLEVDALLVDVAHHLHGQGRHLALRVPGGGGSQVAGGAEVSLPGHQGVAQGPGLHEAGQGVVDRRVPVRVVVAHDLADDAGGLGEGRGGAVAAVVHGVQDAPVNGFEAVAHVGQGAPDDDAHRVVQVGALHLLLQVDLADALGVRDVPRVGGSLVAHVVPSFVLRPRGQRPVAEPLVMGQMSRKRTSVALRWMKVRRLSTSSPMRMVKVSSASAASSRVTCLRIRCSGSIVVSHSSWSFISPRPL